MYFHSRLAMPTHYRPFRVTPTLTVVWSDYFRRWELIVRDPSGLSRTIGRFSTKLRAIEASNTIAAR